MYDPAAIASSPRRVRQSNEVAALRALHQFGRLSRAELARKLKLNRSSAGHIIAGLTAGGLVREVALEAAERPSYARAGRPGILLQLVPEAMFFLGIEIGVEHISVVELDLEAKIVSSSVEPLDGPSTGIEAAVERAVKQAFGAIAPERWDRCEGVGLSVPGQMGKGGFVLVAPLLGWRNLYPAEFVEKALPISTAVMAENDANAFAIGASYGRAVETGVTLFLVLESGVGGGIIIDGTLLRGAHGLAGEIGHLKVLGGEPGRTLEQVIGLEALIGSYRDPGAAEPPRFERLVADVRDRVPRAVAVADEWARALAFGLVQACRIIDPDRIVLGGSVAALYPLVAKRVAVYLQEAQEGSFPTPEITVNEEAAFGSAFGAACMMHQRFLSVDAVRYVEEPEPAEAEQ